MRALLKKTLLLGVCATAGSLVMASPAQAQFSPCQILMPGYVAPPPCITFDYKRLSDLATKQAQEAAKVAAKLEEVKSWASGQAVIGKISQASGVQKLAGTQVFDGLPQTFPDTTSTTSFIGAKAATSKLFSEGTEGVAGMHQIQTQRDQYARSANVDGVALAYRKGQMLDAVLADANRIATAAGNSTDLRTDWAINSEAKRALAEARVTQNYLWQAYLQQQSTTRIQKLPVNLGVKGLAPSAGTTGTSVAADNGDWQRLQQLIALNNEAQNLLSRLGATKSADQVTSIIDQVKADYQDALARQANLVAQFPQKARQWACNADRCSSYMTIVNTSLASLSTWDSQMQGLRAEDISQLGTEFSKRGIDVQAMTSSDIDPRQFIGTWGDPSKYDTILAIANNLTQHALDKYIEGDGDNAAFKQFLYDYNDVRLEVAWKKEAYDQALQAEQDLATTKADIQKDASTTLTEDDVTKRLQEIAAQGNDLGKQLAASSDPAIVESARQRLLELQATLDGGVKLPEPADFDPAICDQAAAYVANPESPQEPVSMTPEEIALCKQQGVTTR